MWRDQRAPLRRDPIGQSSYFRESPRARSSTKNDDGQRAGAIELALEGLYLARKVSKESGRGETVYG